MYSHAVDKAFVRAWEKMLRRARNAKLPVQAGMECWFYEVAKRGFETLYREGCPAHEAAALAQRLSWETMVSHSTPGPVTAPVACKEVTGKEQDRCG